MTIGNIEMMKHNNKIYIRDLTTGEAGSFDVAEISALIARHFAERF